MSRALTFLILVIFLTACRPTYEDWSRDWNKVIQGYLTGDVQTAKAALLEEEKLVAEHQARRNRGVDFVAVKTGLYADLCAISSYTGQTNEARMYYQKYLAVSPKNQLTFEALLIAQKKVDETLKPKWREQR